MTITIEPIKCAGRWPIGEAWVYDKLNNYIGTMTYFDTEQMTSSVDYLRDHGFIVCPREFGKEVSCDPIA